CRSHELSYLVNISLFSYRDFVTEPMNDCKILEVYGVNIVKFTFVLGLQLREEEISGSQFVKIVKCFVCSGVNCCSLFRAVVDEEARDISLDSYGHVGLTTGTNKLYDGILRIRLKLREPG